MFWRKSVNSKSNNRNNWWIFGNSSNPEVTLDPLKKGFLENYGYFLALGGLYLCFPGNWIVSFWHVSSATSHIILLACTVYVINIRDLAITCECLHFIVLLFSTGSMIISSLLLRQKLEFLMRSLGEGVYDYEDTLDDDTITQIKKIAENAKAAKKRNTRIFVTLIMFAWFAIAIGRPITVHLIQKIDFSNDFEGINRYIAVHCWYPFDTQGTFVRILCAVYQYSLIITAPCTVFGFDLTFLYISEEILVQLKTVGITMRNASSRAYRLMKLKGGMQIDTSLAICLNHSVKHHIVITRFFVVFNDIYYYTLLIMMTGATFMLCLSCILFTSNEVGYSSKGTFFFFLMGELAHTFVFCWYGDQIKEASANIGNQIYASDWIKYSKEMKVHVLLIIHKALKPLTINAGGFMDASMDTFANVLSSAYSYFNVLNATR